MQVSHDGKPQFIHRTFAEYYVADCLVNRLRDGNNTSEQVHTFILKDIFQKEKYQVVRAFIERLLSRPKTSNVAFKQYGNLIHDLGKNADKMLHRAALEGNNNIIGFLFDSVQAGDNTDTVNELLLEEDEEGLTAWHIALLYNNKQVLEKIWNFAEKKLTAEKLKNKFLLAKGKVKYESWYEESLWGRQDPIWNIRPISAFLREEKEYGNMSYQTLSVWHVAAVQCNVEVLQKVWEWAKEKLTTEEINNKLLLGTEKDGKTAWQRVAKWRNSDILQKVWEWAKENLTKEEINEKLILGTDKAGKSVWHYAATRDNSEIIQKVWERAKENLTQEEINNKLLLGTDKDGRTAWHYAAKCGNSEILKKDWSGLKRI